MYHITIRKHVEKERWTEKIWTLLEMEYNDEGQEKPKNGYAPQEKYITTEEIVVLDQTVEELDLPVVIAAVNGLELK